MRKLENSSQDNIPVIVEFDAQGFYKDTIVMISKIEQSKCANEDRVE